MNIPDHISESLETIFGLKYFNSLMRAGSGIPESFDPGSGMGKIQIRDKHPGSQHWFKQDRFNSDMFKGIDRSFELRGESSLI
jgi:hypothetical protein